MQETIQDYLNKALKKYKSKTAMEYGFDTLTYEELDERSNYVANYILESKIKKGSFIALLIEDKIEFAIFVFGVLKANCVFVPLDSSYPKERLKGMLKIAEVDYIFLQEGCSIQLFDEDLEINKIIVNKNFFDAKLENGTNEPPVTYSPDDPIYIYFTSGTTGEPKGILGKNKSLLQFIKWEIETFQIDENIHVSQLTTPCHDPWLRDNLVALLSGGVVCIPESREIMLESSSLISWIELSEINLIHCTPSLFRLINTSSLSTQNFINLKYVLMAGERIIPSELENWYSVFGKRIQLVNLYGSTETTMVKTYYLIQPEDVNRISIPVGKPIKGARIIILDSEMQVCAPGDQGQIFIRTPYRTFGYYKRPELTKEKFIQNPFSNNPDDLIYKTGDLGRILPDGNIEYLGRIDRQIKIHGIRVELEEIEAVISSFELVKEAAVVQKIREDGNGILCAYVVEQNYGKDVDFESVLRAFLEERLPIYMLPAYIIRLDQFPLMPNKKIDYKALPEPESNREKEYIAPRDEVEKVVVSICEEILGVDKIGINDNFMRLGGHSLNVMTLITRVFQELGIELSLGDILNDASIETIVRCVKEGSASEYTIIERIPDNSENNYLVSPAQRRQYLLSKIDGNQTAYNITDAKLIDGALDRKRMEEAFEKMIQRHDIFRTFFIFKDGEIYQHVSEDVKAKLEFIDITSVSTEKQYDKARNLIDDFVKPFDLGKAPLIRAMLIKLDDKKHIFVYDMHHIISDETSVDIFTRELMLLYNGEELPELSIRYRDFAVWQLEYLKSEKMKQQEEYWLDIFRNNGDLPILNMPTDYPRPKVQEFAGSLERFVINEKLTKALNELALEEGATLYVTLLSVLNVLFYKYTNQEDIIIGSPIAGRYHADLEDIIGMFVNTLPMRNYPKANLSFREFLNKVKENTYKAYENQDYQFEELINALNLKRDLSSGALFNVMFILQNMYGMVVENKDIKYSPFVFERRTSKMDMTISAVEKDGTIEVELEYCTKLYKKSTILRFINHLTQLIEDIVMNPDKKLQCVDITSKEEIEQQMRKFNNSFVDYDKDILLHNLIEEQAKLKPEATAVQDINGSTTYGALNARANQLAHYLKKEGVGCGSIVGIAISRTVDLFVGLLAILKTGASYLPIDVEFPKKRIAYILNDSGAKTILVDKETKNLIEETVSPDCKLITVALCLYEAEETRNLENKMTPDDLAYVMYTSGSTGNPKGVMIQHKAILHFQHSLSKTIPFNSEKGMLCLTTSSFDIFFIEALYALGCGMKVYMANETLQKDLVALGNYIHDNEIQYMQFTPTRMNAFVEIFQNTNILEKAEIIMLGGEAVQPELLEKLKKETRARIYNLYGPTETTVYSAIKELTFEDKVTVGKPIGNTRIYICNPALKVQPVGLIGEIYIAGDGVAKGYYKREELTKEKFVPDIVNPSECMYNTGDFGYWQENGDIVCLGRSDNQIKIRGFRIELGEIETELVKNENINQAVVVKSVTKNGDEYLCAFYTSNTELDEVQLKIELTKVLPYYMIPSRIIKIQEIPTTPNGKINRSELEKMPLEIKSHGQQEMPTSEMEKVIAGVWKEVLGVEEISLDCDFFSLGGNSLTVIKMQIELEKLGYEIQTSDAFENQTIRQLAHFIECSGNVEITATEVDGASEKKNCNDLQATIIENVEPFNLFMYESCFYNAVFPAIIHYCKHINAVLANTVICYHFSKENRLFMNYKVQKSLKDVLKKENVYMQEEYEQEKCVETIMNAIDKKRPVIACVDCFYEKIRTDVYHKEHREHYLLVYGYNTQSKEFYIIEQLNYASLTYEKKKISFDDLKKSIAGYAERFNEKKNPLVLEIYMPDVVQNKSVDISIYRNEFIENFQKCKEKYLQGIESLLVYKKYFNEIILNEDLFQKKGDEIIEDINNITNAKKSEIYKLKQFFSEDLKPCELQKTILKQWMKIRSVIAKTVYSKKYIKENLEESGKFINEIYNLECEYYEALLGYEALL